MRDNVKQFLQLLTEAMEPPPPVLEIGALQTEGQESYADMRPFFPDGGYVGLDMRRGAGVDCLGDAHRLPCREASVGTVLLLDTLEHVVDPFAVLQEVCRVLRPGGMVLASSHMNFPIHAFPSDYWRFTPMAFDRLLQPLQPRFIFAQGDAEFPHTVIGLGMRAPAGDGMGALFRAAVREVQSRWPEEVYGGPLLASSPAVIAVAQRLAERRLPELEQGRTIAQSFVCPSNHLSRIDVKMSNLGRSNLCHVLFHLHQEDERRQEIAAYRLFAFHIIDEAWTSIPIPLQVESAGRRYLLTVESPDGVVGQAVTAMASNDTLYQEGQLLIDGEPAQGSLCFQVYCQSSDEAISVATRTGSFVATDAGGPSRDAGGEGLAADDIAALMLRAEERGWQQMRYVAAVIGSGLDTIRAELKAMRADQRRAEARLEARLEALQRTQLESLEQSTEAAALARVVRRSPLGRLWRRFVR